jgi:hypothetical protein
MYTGGSGKIELNRVSLPDVEKLAVTSIANTTDGWKASPEFYDLGIHTEGTTIRLEERCIDCSSNTAPIVRMTAADYIHFRSEEMANRVARALTHAVELCRKGKKAEPF